MNSKVSRRVLARTIAAKLLAEPSRRGHWMRVLAAYLLEQKLTDDINLVVNDIAHELFTQGSHLYVTVTSARALHGAVRDDIVRSLRAATNAKYIELAEHTNPDLLGGVVARTPDAVLDASVRTKLKQLATI
ncbi:MAG TPA: F0F1 ATP synthase subunit delta [Candidatus Saccharimonadales bacterium]|nr:F0F1 ATP synthase subunit delta [Candidatus Saccharimonadales bacterium]